ncbi:nucleotide disphospho-sugar-binding domain-containing protein [Streptomyces sp. NPDC059639]|uniref:nucleotide disphospho-sugar-binding domain-containing protein n=1 Tax=Streptomyces sp. NPDC059639 TaxID=3346891 RepID=UPI0036C57440
MDCVPDPAPARALRVLFVPFPGVAHVHPLVPLAWALSSAGHQVRVAVHPGLTDVVGAAGLTAVPLGDTGPLSGVVRFRTDPALLDVLSAQLSLDEGVDEGDGSLWEEKWAQTLGPMAVCRSSVDELTAYCADWRPDLVIWDPFHIGAPVAAKACGAAHARLLWGRDNIGWLRAKSLERLAGPHGASSTDPVPGLMAPMLDPLDLAYEEELLLGQWTIDPMPPDLRLPVAGTSVPVRRIPYNGTAVLPGWLRGPARRPRVCLTLGVGGRGRQLLRACGNSLPELLDATADLDVEMVVTLEAGRFAGGCALPDNVRMTDYLPLDLLLPGCSAVVHHGGGGTFAAATQHAVPQLVVPMDFWGEKAIARHVAELGAGLVVDSERFTPQSLREGITQLLAQPSFREGARALRTEAETAPTPAAIVPTLEELTARHRN